MTTLNEPMREGEFIGELAMGLGYHVEAITLKSGENLSAGAVLGVAQTGTPTVTAGTPVSGTGGTVGNGTVGTWTGDAGIMEGEWTIEITTSGATGKFKVVRPDGTTEGTGTVGTAYNGGLNGTLADGSNDWTAGDIIPVTVTYDGDDTVLVYEEYDVANTNGSQTVAAILMKNTDASGGATATTALVRGPAVVNKNDLSWFSGATAAQKAEGIEQLQNLGIKAV
jgi:hypothetical protein